MKILPFNQRRHFIKGMLTSAVLVSMPVKALESENEMLMKKLSAAIHKRLSAIEVGQAYLDSCSQQLDSCRLLDDVVERMGGATEVSAMNSRQLRQRLGQASSRDFDQRETIKVKGWLLSATEVKLCALMALQA